MYRYNVLAIYKNKKLNKDYDYCFRGNLLDQLDYGMFFIIFCC